MEEETGDEVNLAPDADGFLEVLAKGTASKVEEIDELIRKRAENWRLDRMPKVDRTILRMAIYEMKDVGTPPPIVIDEALELARRYSEEEAVPFINGVLDSIRRMILPEEAERPAS
jgi:N utilization substance protein B